MYYSISEPNELSTYQRNRKVTNQRQTDHSLRSSQLKTKAYGTHLRMWCFS